MHHKKVGRLFFPHREAIQAFVGFAAGCMIWISFAEIIPDALENVSPTTLATATTTSTFAFKALQYTFDAVMYGR